MYFIYSGWTLLHNWNYVTMQCVSLFALCEMYGDFFISVSWAPNLPVDIIFDLREL
jgi:hypothetical protein